MAAAGFQLDQLLAACAQLAKQPNDQEDISREAQQQDEEAEQLEAVLEGSEDADDLYADLQHPTGASTCLQRAPVLLAYVISMSPGRLPCVAQSNGVSSAGAVGEASSVLVQQQQEQIQQVRQASVVLCH